MKKNILFSLLCSTSFLSFSQVEIYEGSGTTDISGTTIYVDVDPAVITIDNPWEAHFIVKNVSGTDKQYRITRVRTTPAGWLDDLCWPPTCYVTNSAGNFFQTPHDPANFDPAPYVLNGTTTATLPGLSNALAEIKPVIKPNFSSYGTATYKYYVTEATSGTYEDSLFVVFNYSLSVEEKPAASMSISPNPASEFVNVTLEGVDGAKVKIVDVLGNVVYTKEINATSKIGVADFKNGVYFVTIEGDNKKTITKKLMIRH